MAQVCIDTDSVEYPSWWALATEVEVTIALDGTVETFIAQRGNVTFGRTGIEVLPSTLDPFPLVEAFYAWTGVRSIKNAD